MTTSLDDVLSGAAPQEPNDAAQQQQGDTATAATEQSTTGDAATQAEAQQAAATLSVDEGADASATPAQQTGSMVPLKALEEERKGRQDWKEKAIRAEAALEALRTQHSQPQAMQAQQPVEMDLHTTLLNERFNTSEMLLRAKHDDVDDMVKIFQEAVAKNPALGAEMGRQINPYGWMYDQAKRIQAMEEIGSDPAAYRQKLRDELMAEMQAQQSQASTDASTVAQTTAITAQPVIPKTLATARSAAPRTAPAWTGPTALSDILNSKR
ncbi:hypothetical protein [Pandoraea apista]|uniref:hypothetical protein n=1 Tax=Pandoraea apista TaxID=93218 RepID=UPI000658F44D|nr:hypothetical protein [Pandoraea apista]ALS63618.1 hypothetical protein AT395_00160 [Pandoraea apista]CFB63147.1 hypothetical protein LMG16407_03222 [Pandoraea apista]